CRARQTPATARREIVLAARTTNTANHGSSTKLEPQCGVATLLLASQLTLPLAWARRGTAGLFWGGDAPGSHTVRVRRPGARAVVDLARPPGHTPEARPPPD